MHLSAFGKFIDEFVEVTDLAHEWVFHFLDTHAARYALRMKSRGLCEERLNVVLQFELLP
ncbi:MAG: hypothetical protein NZM33_17145 [Bryobacteraceae bacterium]|nr:hypothetical protein [Bryobacteraceae bacterium]